MRKPMATVMMTGRAASVVVVGSGVPVGAQTAACTFTAVAGSTTVLPTQITVGGAATSLPRTGV